MNVKELREVLEATIARHRVNINVILDDHNSKLIQDTIYQRAMTKGYALDALVDNNIYLAFKVEDKICLLVDIMLCNTLKDEDITNELIKTITDEIYNHSDILTRRENEKYKANLKAKFKSLPLGLCKEKVNMKECHGCVFNEANSIIRCNYTTALDKENICTGTCPVCGGITLEEEVTSSNPGAMTECTNINCDYRCNQFLDYEDFKRL